MVNPARVPLVQDRISLHFAQRKPETCSLVSIIVGWVNALADELGDSVGRDRVQHDLKRDRLVRSRWECVLVIVAATVGTATESNEEPVFTRSLKPKSDSVLV